MAEKNNSESKGSTNAAASGKDVGKDKDAGAGKDANKDAAKETVKDKVGDILRKERLTRRITIETIAKDLKLNVGYVKALEASDYDSLPPDPYIRVYIRSLTKYLSLDSDSILKEFYKERGLIADDSAQTQGNKIDVTVQRQDKNPAVIFIAALIVVLLVFAIIAKKKGWISEPPETATTAIEDKSDTAAMADHDALSKKIADSILDATIAGQRQESEPTPPTVTKSKSIGTGTGATRPAPPPAQPTPPAPRQ